MPPRKDNGVVTIFRISVLKLFEDVELTFLNHQTLTFCIYVKSIPIYIYIGQVFLRKVIVSLTQLSDITRNKIRFSFSFKRELNERKNAEF